MEEVRAPTAARPPRMMAQLSNSPCGLEVAAGGLGGVMAPAGRETVLVPRATVGPLDAVCRILLCPRVGVQDAATLAYRPCVCAMLERARPVSRRDLCA